MNDNNTKAASTPKSKGRKVSKAKKAAPMKKASSTRVVRNSNAGAIRQLAQATKALNRASTILGKIKF